MQHHADANSGANVGGASGEISEARVKCVIEFAFQQVVDSPTAGRLARGLYWVLPNLAQFDVKGDVVHGVPVPFAYMAFAIAYAALYIAMLLATYALPRGGALRDASLVQFPLTVGVWAIFVLLFVKLK